MENKQTSVEWLENKINTYDFNQGMAQMRKYIMQAKAMHEEEIKDAFGIWEGDDQNEYNFDAERYYNETYGK